MKIDAATPEQYLEQVPEDRKNAFQKVRDVIKDNLPVGFTETMNYGMIGYVVPHTLYPKGYHVDTSLPLPFINLASQKNFIALYHMGIYMNDNLLNWFREEYPKHSSAKLDIGKGCIRFKNTDKIPFELIGKLSGKMTVEEWINLYEQNLKK